MSKLRFNKTNSPNCRDVIYNGKCIGLLYKVSQNNIGWTIDIFNTTIGDGYLYNLTAARKEILNHLKNVGQA